MCRLGIKFPKKEKKEAEEEPEKPVEEPAENPAEDNAEPTAEPEVEEQVETAEEAAEVKSLKFKSYQPSHSCPAICSKNIAQTKHPPPPILLSYFLLSRCETLNFYNEPFPITSKHIQLYNILYDRY